MKKYTARLTVVLTACVLVVIFCVYLTGKESNIANKVTDDQQAAEATTSIEQPAGVIALRVKLMNDLQQAITTLQSAIWNPITFDAKVIEKQTQIISDKSEEMLTLFPKDSLSETGRASPNIRDSWETFKQLAENAKSLAQELRESVQDHAATENALDLRKPSNVLIPDSNVFNNQAPDASNIAIAPNMPHRYGTTGNLPVPGVSTLNFPQGTGLMGNNVSNISNIHVGKDGKVVMPPQITFQRLTRVCIDCHNQFLSLTSDSKVEQ